MADNIEISVEENVDQVEITIQEGVTAPVLFGTGSPPSATGLVNGTIYFQIVL